MTRGSRLQLADLVLKTLVVLNYVYGAIVGSILTGLFLAAPWTMSGLGVPHEAQTATYLNGMRAIAALGLVAIPLSLGMLRRLLAMVESVRAGDPFVADNALRLNAIAWILLGQQLLSLVIALIARSISTPEHQLHLNAGFSPSGWLALIMVFVLARVFAEGTRMRADLAGTV